MNTLKIICFNREYWEDYMLAVVGMGATWRAHGMMPHFFMEKDGDDGF